MQARIYRKLQAFVDDPRPPGVKALEGAGNGWRLRVGRYRVLYEIDDGARLVTIRSVGHRREAYRD